MTTDKLPFPPNLPPLPEPPAGHEWVYRGREWLNTDRKKYIYFSDAIHEGWRDFTAGNYYPAGCVGHYAEAVKIESPADPDYASREYQLSVISAALDKRMCQFESVERNGWIDEPNAWNITMYVWQGIRVRIKPQPDPYADLKAAHAAGEPIQMLYEGKWTTWLRPDWTCPPEEYRIKPAKKRIPLTAEDIPAVCWVRFRVESPNVLIHSIDSCGVSYAGKEREHEVTFQELMRDGWEYSEDRRNWNPCCKEIEE